jgi:hypothetical protein
VKGRIDVKSPNLHFLSMMFESLCLDFGARLSQPGSSMAKYLTGSTRKDRPLPSSLATVAEKAQANNDSEVLVRW